MYIVLYAVINIVKTYENQFTHN